MPRLASLVALVAAGLCPLGCGSSAPSADAGDDFSVAVGEAPVFDGCGSSGEALSYTWTIVEAPADMSDDVGKVIRESVSECSFTLESDMVVADMGTWVVELMVTDGVSSSSDQVTVAVT